MLPRVTEMGRNAKTNTWIFTTLAITLLLITESRSQQLNQVDVEPAESLARENEPITIICRAAQPISFCRFIIPNEPVKIMSPDIKLDGFDFAGEGLQNGQCGITIKNVQTKHNGQVNCTLALGSIEVTGSSHIVVGKAPDRPILNILTQAGPGGAYEVNEEFRAECISQNGRPAPNLTWWLGGERIVNGLSQPQLIAGDNSFGTKQEFQRALQTADDQIDLACRAEHFSIPQGFLEVRHRFTVRYRPQVLPAQHVTGLVIGRTGTLNVTFRANPQPRVEWYVDGTAIQQGAQVDRYEASIPQNMGAGEWMANLVIADLTLEDTTKEYYLKASNEFGATEYTVFINSLDSETAAGLAVGWIVLIVIVILIVILSTVLVVVARRTGRWCFADRSGSQLPKPAETSDTESVETGKQGAKTATITPAEPKSKLRKPNLNIHAIFKKPNKNAVPKPEENVTSVTTQAPVDGQQPPNPTRDSEETVVITDELPAKK